MEEEKRVKTTIAARVNAPLKSAIIQESEAAGMTPSLYVETLLKNRVANNAKNIEVLEKEVEKWKEKSKNFAKKLKEQDAEIEEIETEVEEIQTKASPLENTLYKEESADEEIKDLKDNCRLLRKENLELQEQLDDAIKERDTAIEERQIEQAKQFNFSEAEEEVFYEKLNYIKEYYPKYSDEQILVAALKCTIYNAKDTFFGTGIRGFLPKLEEA